MIWLIRKLGWLVCLAADSIDPAGLVAFLLFISFTGGELCRPCLLTALAATPLGLGLAKLGFVMSGD